ncbi:conjugal transfer protein TraH, partial [Oleiphilus sp. HI0043]
MRTVLLTTILIMAAIPSALAGVVDDWLSDLESSVGASAYNSGSRGYLSAGSVNARVSSTSEYLMSINPPRLDAGACGVDLFLGGMSYMDIDYLGDKLEAV